MHWEATGCFVLVFALVLRLSQVMRASITRVCSYAWYGNSNYEWPYFLAAAGISTLAMFVWIGAARLLKAATGKEGVPVSALLCGLPGCHFVRGVYGNGCRSSAGNASWLLNHLLSSWLGAVLLSG
jgi:hypothetical protein